MYPNMQKMQNQLTRDSTILVIFYAIHTKIQYQGTDRVSNSWFNLKPIE